MCASPAWSAPVDDHFQELAELVRGLAVLGELTPRAVDAIASFGERLSSLIVANQFEKHGMHAVHVDARKVIVTDARHTQAVPNFPETYQRLSRTIPPLTQRQVVVMGGFIGGYGRWCDDNARPRRVRFHRCDRRRRNRCRRDPDLDRCGRHAHGGSARDAWRPPRSDVLVCRSRRTRLLRREGAAPVNRAARGREKHPGPDPELAPARRGRHAHHRRHGSLHQRRQGDCLQAGHQPLQHPFHSHADGARISAAHLRDLRPRRNAGGHAGHHGGQRIPHRGQHEQACRVSATN